MTNLYVFNHNDSTSFSDEGAPEHMSDRGALSVACRKC
jgi:hypothetical protein